MKVHLQEAHTPRAGIALGAVMDSPQSQLIDTHPGSPTPSQDTALSRGAAPPPPQLPQLHPQQVRGAQGAPWWGSCAPLPPPQNLPDPLTTQSGWPNVQRQVWTPLLQGQRGGAGNPDGLTPQGLRGGLEGRGHCFLQGRELRCPAAKWMQLLCRLKNQPELRDPDPAKSTDTRKSSWEAPPRGSHGSRVTAAAHTGGLLPQP